MTEKELKLSENKPAEKGEERQVGVYVCHCGGNISNTVDVEKVVEAAAEMKGVTFAKHNIFICSDPGQDLIIDDIKSGKVNRVVVASCAPSLHETTFRNAVVRAGLNPYLYIHANIREQVSFIHEGEEATQKAISLVNAGVLKALEIEALSAPTVEVMGHVTVIGGGVSGLKAALDLASRGLKVALIEKTPYLGGRTSNLNTVYPTGENAEDIIKWLAEKVINHPGIDLYTCSEVIGQEGYIGNFTLRIKKNSSTFEPDSDKDSPNLPKPTGVSLGDFIPFSGICPIAPPEHTEELELPTGAIVIATGFSLYEPKTGELGYKDFPEVITLADLIRIMYESDNHGDHLSFKGRKIKSMAMIHCVGSRQVHGIHEPDENGHLNENCSRTCCTSLLYNALEIKKKHPETVIYDFHRDIRTYGRGHEEIYQTASENDVRFLAFQAEAPPVIVANKSSEYTLSVKVKDTLLMNQEIEIPVDLIVLGTGMLPGQIDPLTEVTKTHKGADGFLLEVHPKLRPVEVFTAGIFLAGTCQAPMDITEAVTAAAAAAAKVSIILSRKEVELEPFIATVDEDKCSACLTCVRTCPFDVPKIEDGAAFIHPAACYGCGSCVAACPGGAISLAHFDDNQIGAQVKGALANETDKSGGDECLPDSTFD